MKIVAVCSCPSGVAHTYLAAESLEQAGKRAGHQVSVEVQGSLGAEPLPQSVIDEADGVIFAADIAVRGQYRFLGKPTIEVDIKRAVTEPDAVISDGVAEVEKERAPGVAEAMPTSGEFIPANPELITEPEPNAEPGTDDSRADDDSRDEPGSTADTSDGVTPEDGESAPSRRRLRLRGRRAAEQAATLPTPEAVPPPVSPDAPAMPSPDESESTPVPREGTPTVESVKVPTSAPQDRKVTPTPDGKNSTSGRRQDSEPHQLRSWMQLAISVITPVVAVGGILIALAYFLGTIGWPTEGASAVTAVVGGTGDVALGYATQHGIDLGEGAAVTASDIAASFDWSVQAWGVAFYIVGQATLALVVPVLAGAIAFALGSRPAIAPGLVGGAVASILGLGFLGALIAGFLAGFLVRGLLRVPVAARVRGMTTYVAIPLLAAVVTAATLIVVLGPAIGDLNGGLSEWLGGLDTSELIPLGIILGLLVSFDLGGPASTAAMTFAVAGLTEAGSESAPAAVVMAAVMAAGMVPGLASSVAVLIRRRLFSATERQASATSWVLGLSGLSQGGFPIAAADPLRVVPSFMVGGATAGGLVAFFGAGVVTPVGGLWVTSSMYEPVLFALALVLGTLVSAGLLITFKSIGVSDPTVGDETPADWLA